MDNIFANKKPNYKKLINYGFKNNGQKYSFLKEIFKDQFQLIVEVEGKDVNTELVDIFSGDLYTLHLMDSAEGTFIGQVREEYEAVLRDISKNCFETDVFEFEQTFELLDYVLKKYGAEPEYLWEKFPRNAVCRRKDNQKWYLAILSVKGSTLGLEGEDIVEVVDLRASKDSVAELLKKEYIYPAYHMNKKSWITIILNHSVETDEIYKYVDESYRLAGK